MELSRLALAEGAYDEAEDWLKQGLSIYKAFGLHWLMGELLAQNCRTPSPS